MEWSLTKYEDFIYAIADQFSSVTRSDLIVKRHGKVWAEVAGRVYFENDYILEVREVVDFLNVNFIRRYGYAARKKEDILYWYDSQEHPHNLNLQTTYPHHKHVPPDMKHNRIPAPQMRFDQPNLAVLIREIEALIKANH